MEIIVKNLPLAVDPNPSVLKVALAQAVAAALADACPTREDCRGDEESCIRRHGLHATAWRRSATTGHGKHFVDSIEGDLMAIARIAVDTMFPHMNASFHVCQTGCEDRHS
jgi:hypothetical protein